jgi:hypothetical protein
VDSLRRGESVAVHEELLEGVDDRDRPSR